MKLKYKTGIIGLGQIAYSIDNDKSRKIIWSHINAYRKSKTFQIEAISDISYELLNNIGDEINVNKRYTNYKEMLLNEKLVVVSICTPIHTHLEIIEECLKYSNIKVIFCEKTLAFDYNQAKLLVEKCKKKNVLLVINHILRWDSRIIQIKEIVKSEILGKVTSVVAYSNTALHTSASHMIDVLCFIFEDLKVIYGKKQTDYVRNVHGYNDYGAYAFLESKNIPFFLKSNSNNMLKFVFELDIFFENGRLRIWDNLEKLKLFEFKNKVSKTGANYMKLEENKNIKSVKENQRMLLAVESIYLYLKENKIPVSTGETSLATLKIIEGILK